MSVRESFYNRMRIKILNFNRIIKHVPKSGEVLDFGCSFGTFSFLMSERNPYLRITGVDLDRKRIAKAKLRAGNNGNLKFIAGDVTKMETDEKYDAVTCIDVFHHIPRRYHAMLLKKIRGLLKKNGTLILKDMDTKPYRKYLWNFLHDVVMTHSKRMWYTSSEDFLKSIENAGFRITGSEDMSNAFYAHYLIVAVKA